MKILGISAFYHDSAAALVEDGAIIAAAQEERFTRKKHDAHYPQQAISYCLKERGISLREIDYIVFYDKPFLKFERLLETYLALAPRGFSSFVRAMPLWIQHKLFQKSQLIGHLKELAPEFDWEKKLLFSEHHLSHAASAFYPSPFSKAVILTMDGVGEWATSSAAIGVDNTIDIQKEIFFPHSLGLLYSAFTYYLGFKVNSGEYKVMGLAPYGEPRFASLIREYLIDIKADGSYRLNLDYFSYCTGLSMTNERFHELFQGQPRLPEAELTQKHMDIAASIQAVTEEIILRMTRALAHETRIENLCLAGGVALNCVANGKVLQDASFRRIWVQPAAGDAGGALGAALAAYHLHLQLPRASIIQGKDGMRGAYLGPAFTIDEIEHVLQKLGAKYSVKSEAELLALVAQDLAAGKAVGWFQGRMEFGPRALGARSILADPRSATMQSTLNLKVKFRESFRPFAPAILREDLAEWFDLAVDSPYMLLVAAVAEGQRLPVQRSSIPAVTHVDNSARVQTVHHQTNPKFHALLSKFKEITGCPVLVNTSFNVRGEPIVCSPEDAYRCFMSAGIERLAIGNCYLCKEEQPQDFPEDHKDFELD